MTSLTLIVDGELTAICRPIRCNSIQDPPMGTMGVMLDLPVAPAGGEDWWVEEDVPDAWRRDELMRVFSTGMPQAARAILEEIALQPDGYPFDDLHRIVGMSRLAVAAILGAAAEAVQACPGKPALVRQDHEARTYCMPRDVASFLVPCANRDDVETVEDGTYPGLMSRVTSVQARRLGSMSNRLP